MARFANPLNRYARRGGEGTVNPDAPVPLGQRELRAQAVHRLQIGLSGLAAMLLLVGLASVIMQHARQISQLASSGPAGLTSSSAPVADPLVDMGVAPEVHDKGQPSRGPSGAAPAGRAMRAP